MQREVDPEVGAEPGKGQRGGGEGEAGPEVG